MCNTSAKILIIPQISSSTWRKVRIKFVKWSFLAGYFLQIPKLCLLLQLSNINFQIMKTLGYLGAFIGGAIAGAALGVLMAPEKGSETQKKLVDTIDDFCKKHNIKLSKKDVDDLVDDIKDATDTEA